MIIDLILDRKETEIYNPRNFYFSVLQYLNGCGGTYAEKITAAMDYGTETEVKQALCNYIIDCDYNPEICNFINSRLWLTEAEMSDTKRKALETLETVKQIYDNSESDLLTAGFWLDFMTLVNSQITEIYETTK